MPINLPTDVVQIIASLEKNGYAAYAVGGSVRDALLGQKPADWDITTSATPAEVMRSLPGYRILPTGLPHGTVTVLANNSAYEITTFRVDGAYIDNRHPDTVSFTTELANDLSRRDFTINAMAYNNTSGLVDYFHGKPDLQNKIIRCVGEADKRFQEDGLRLMRALRFAAVLDFTIEPGTAEAIHHNRQLLKNIAPERIRTELDRLIDGDGAGPILINYADVLCVFIPEIQDALGFEQHNPHHYLDVWRHTVTALTHAPAGKYLRLALLFHDLAKPNCYTRDKKGIGHFYGHPVKSAVLAENIMRRLKYDNETINIVKELILYHDQDILPQDKHIKKWLNRLGEIQLRRLWQIKKADIMAQHEAYRAGRLNALKEAALVLDRVLDERQCFTLQDLAVNGHDLIDLGIPQGIKTGLILNQLLDMVITEKIINEKENLLKAATKIAAQLKVTLT